MTRSIDSIMTLAPVIPVLVIEDVAHALPVAQALAWLADGTITDVKTIIGLMMLEQRLAQSR